MLTLSLALLILAYLFLYSGFSHPHGDGSAVTPLDLIRGAIKR